ncbi:MAG: type II CRISPR RNA-guided endonuclease Cas9 [Planctomycetota bacterium]|jgi:CRISPR-associated endonuclease Csn1
MSKYTLGLDLGSNSIGWALLDTGETPKIIDLGVRVFPEGVDRDKNGGEISKNASRREARGARRNRWRRAYRKDKLVRMLQREGLLPKKADAIEELMKTNPYPLRAKGLDERLELYEFGRVLFHINQRRGFKSNRKTGEAKENGVVKQSASALQESIDKAGCRTLGEYFAKINPEDERIRAHYTFRSMYEHEIDLLWQKQAESYADILTERLKEEIKDKTIFYQRPLKPTDELIGECSLEPGEKRCPRSDWYARRFRILQDINNLKIYNPDGSEQELSDDQRQIALKEMLGTKNVNFGSLRKKLGLIETQTFNLEEGQADKKSAKLKGDEFAAQMRSKNILGAKKWNGLDIKEQVEINESLIANEIDDVTFVKMLIEQHAFTEEQATATLDVTLPQRYMSLSQIAIQKLLPYMEKGLLTPEAIKKVYGERAIEEENLSLDKLPMPDDLRNPIVNQALFEMKKVLNAIIKEYGKPDKIAIEMARDVHGGKKQREETHLKMWKNKQRNERARKELIENTGIKNPTRGAIIKYKLWEECRKVCPYTGRSIPQYALFGDNPEFQVEHIIPYSRCLDDSFMNKTLCEVHENIHVKKNQTPYEAYGSDPKKFKAILQRIKVLLYPKRKKFWQEKVELDDFIERQLNDTRYITRETIKYLKRLGVHVYGTKGKITGELRHSWGLNNILDFTGSGLKNRDDHRHHTIDAAVVAVTRNKHLRELAKTKHVVDDNSFEQPWPNFRQEVQSKINKINVSHRATRKVSGALHKDTNYGPTGQKDGNGKNIYVYRKKVEDLTGSMIGCIVDKVVRDIIKARLSEFGQDSEKGSKKFPKEVWQTPIYMKTTNDQKGPLIKSVRIHKKSTTMVGLKDKAGKVYRAVEPGSNHHIEIFEYTDKKGNVKRDSKVVSMFEAVQRNRKGEPVIQRDHGEGKKFICSLSINEMVMMKNKDGEMDLYRVQKMSINKQIYFQHHTAAIIDNEETLIRKQANLFDGKKVTVDPIGRIFPAND